MNRSNPGFSCAQLSLLLIALAAGLVRPSPSFAQEAMPAVDEAARLVAVFESFEAQQDPGAEVPDPAQLASAYRALEDFLTTNPDDARALLLLARTGRILRLMEPMVLTQGRASSNAPSADASIAALQHALEIDPGSAEAHYWLARIYGTTGPKIVDDVLTNESLDLEQAIVHAQRALELEPAEPLYREACGVYLAQAHRYADALAAFGDHEHVVRRILEDLEAVPLPAGARYMPVESATMAEVMTNNGRFTNYGALRVRAYLLDGGRSVFEDALRTRWPDLELYESQRDDDGDGGEVVMSVQTLRQNGDGLEPTPVKELERTRDEQDPDGLAVAVLEFVNPSDETLSRFQAADTERLAVLTLISTRKPALDAVALTELGKQLLGEWAIDEWSYEGNSGRESYTGTLTVTTQLDDDEFEGELFSRSQTGNWGRQRMRIVADGKRLELTGRVVAAGGTWFPDNLSLTLDGDRLSGRSIDSAGDGGAVTFVKR